MIIDLIQSKHFQFEYIEKGNWSRLGGTNAAGGENTRPHFVPKTEEAETYLKMGLFFGFGTGLCPGLITVDGEEKLAFRFVVIENPEEAVPKMLAQLDEAVEQLNLE